MKNHSTGLYSLSRGGITEIEMFGEIVVTDDRKVLFQTSDALGSYPARSLLKPFQYYATGLVPQSSSDLRHTASLGSLSATREQVATLKQWYDEPKLKALSASLQVPASYPMDETHRVGLKEAGEKPQKIFHMCFSKHMAILEACEKNGWDLASYTSVDHPYYKKLISSLSSLLGEDISGVKAVGDGCTLPSPVLTMKQLAILYQRLAMMGGEMAKIRERMIASPEWIGGPSRLDTKFMQLNSGKVMAKEGADGLLGISVLPSKEYPSGLGIVVKILSGYQPPLAMLALDPLLKKLGLSGVAEVPKGQDVEFHYLPFEKSPNPWIDISPTLSTKTAIFPGDRAFKRMVSMETQKGQHLTLSAMETTLHLGAHTDAPNHFEKVTEGISEVSVEKYIGPAQVIEVKKISKGVITSKDFKGTSILAKRVLFKTGSMPDPNHFNEDFMCLSEEVVEFLGRQGVVLVGIDTPSIDPAASKTLSAHHMTTKFSMGILEGIVLSAVSPGLYELLAQPLPIQGGDASPVRALLRGLR